MPHELQALAPLITDFFKAVGYTKAAEKPWPVINEIYQEMLKNRYSIVYVCVDQDMTPQGYCWFRVDRNVWNEAFITIEHDYIIAEHRHTMREAKIHRAFIEYIIEIGERCNTQYVNTSVRTPELEQSRKKLGFEAVELKLTFNGDAIRFRERNPSFQKYGQYEDEQETEDAIER